MNTEIRTLPAVELRVEGEADKPKIVGYAAVFDSMSHDLGGFRETIAPSAFADAAAADVRARYNHELVIGRTKAGTLRLSVDERGLRYEIDPPAHAMHVVEAIRRGDVDGSSFAFRVPEGGDHWEKRDGTLVRELRNVQLVDVGPVDFPAYPGTADSGNAVSVRALDRAKELAQPETPTTPNLDARRNRRARLI